MTRFWDKVEKTDNCWLWKASGRGQGYGSFKYEGKVYDAHRFVWFLTYSKWPEEWILHKCNNKKCVNPKHLYDGTPKENYADMRLAGNVYQQPKIYPSVRARKKAAFKRWYERIKNEPDRGRYNQWRSTQRTNKQSVV